jgi:hypothetical protein
MKTSKNEGELRKKKRRRRQKEKLCKLEKSITSLLKKRKILRFLNWKI